MKPIRIEAKGKVFEGFAQKLKGKLWVHLHGKTFVVEATEKKSRKKSQSHSASDQILAPMPGKVTKILVQADEAVQPGQALLVMEAMKMEYTLKSEAQAVVKAITCAEGEQVALGQKLVQLHLSKEAQ